MAACSEDFHYRDEFDAVLVILCSYRYDANVFEEVQKNAQDEKKYLKCSLCIRD